MPRSKEQFKEMRERARSAILDASLQLFAGKGFSGTSIDDIAKKAKISKGLIYNYFESKQAILSAILEEMMKEGEKFISLMQSVDDPYEKIRVLIEASFKYYEENEEKWKLYIAFFLHPEVLGEGRKLNREFSQKYINGFKDMLLNIGFKNPSIEILVLSALLDGIGLDYFFDKEMFPLKEVKGYVLKRYSKDGIEKMRNAGLLE